MNTQLNKFKKNDDFILYAMSKRFDKYLRYYIVNNIPRVSRDIRIHIIDESYKMLENFNRAQYTKGNIRIKYITDILVNISMLDYLLGLIEGMKIKELNKKHYTSTMNLLTDISNMVKKWRTTEEKKKLNEIKNR